MNPGGPFTRAPARATIRSPVWGPKESVEVVLVDMPQMLHDIIREQIAHAPGLRVAAEVADVTEADAAVTRAAADVVIAGADALDVFGVDRLLSAHPRLTVLTIDREGRETVLSELRPHRQRLGELSPQRLLEVVRAARFREQPC